MSWDLIFVFAAAYLLGRAATLSSSAPRASTDQRTQPRRLRLAALFLALIAVAGGERRRKAVTPPYGVRPVPPRTPQLAEHAVPDGGSTDALPSPAAGTERGDRLAAQPHYAGEPLAQGCGPAADPLAAECHIGRP